MIARIAAIRQATHRLSFDWSRHVRSHLRLLPLPLAIAIALPLQAQQRLYESEMQPDYALCPAGDAIPAFTDVENLGINMKPAERKDQPTNLEADEQSGTIETPILEGNVALRRGDQFLGTDHMVFDSEKNTYVAEGNVRYQDSGIRIIAQRASGNQADDTHQIEDLQYQLIERRGNGGAERIEMSGEHGSLINSTYSTCPPQEQHWKLVAGRIDVDSEEGFAVARNARLRIGSVPVLYMPWFKFPIDDRRHTGLLMPSISNSNRNGFDIRQPIYLNLAPNYDLTLSPRLMSRRGASLGSEFRYLEERGAGVIRAVYMPDDKLRERDRYSFNAGAYRNLSRNWRIAGDVNYFSDTRYLEDFNNTSFGNAYYNVRSEIGLYGRGTFWSASLTADYYQLTDHTLTRASLPYNRLPRAIFNWEQPVGSLFRVGMESEAVRFRHVDWRQIDADYQPYGPNIPYPGGSRLDLKPWVSLPLSGASWFVEPKFAWRHTAYQLDDALARNIDAANPQRSPSRSLPIFSLDAGLQFEREFQRAGKHYLQTLEPRLFYLNVPYRNQDHLPIFDTRGMTFSWGQLFRDNRYTGPDRQSDANQITTAITTRILRDSDGFERLSASLGQIHYLEDLRIGASGSEPAVRKGGSAWVADATWAPSDRWQIGASYQWDPKEHRKDLVAVRGRYLMKDDGIVNLAYRYRRDVLEQADFSFVYPINPTWSLVGRYYYSIKDQQGLESLGGVQWDSCCVSARLLARRYIRNREGEFNNSIMLEIEFKGLGSAGQNAKRTLRHAILGYHRDDLYLVPPPSMTGGTPTPDTTDPTP